MKFVFNKHKSAFCVVIIAIAITILSYTIAGAVNNKPDTYPVNENGQTYGSSAYAASPENEPDLISVVGEDGVRGYVYKTDLDDSMPRTPEEAIASMYQNRGPRELTVYEADGVTAIGIFIIAGGEMIIPSEYDGDLPFTSDNPFKGN